jgi:putative acetyltransferase
MNSVEIRPAELSDRAAIHEVVARAFGQKLEAELVDRLVGGGDAVLELVAEADGRIVGHVLFSRLAVGESSFPAVALAPLAVDPAFQKMGIGAALVSEAHGYLAAAGEKLSIVLGDPAYYGRFGYRRQPAEAYSSDYQCDSLQALAWGAAPATGRLVYAAAFAGL